MRLAAIRRTGVPRTLDARARRSLRAQPSPTPPFPALPAVRSPAGCQVTDLTSALDQPEIAPADFEFLKLMTLPGAVDLLKRYEVMSPESRRLLVDLLQSIVVEPA